MKAKIKADPFDSTAITLTVHGVPPGLPSLAVANNHLKLRFKSRGYWPYFTWEERPIFSERDSSSLF